MNDGPRLLITGACGVTSRSVARGLRLDPDLTDIFIVGAGMGVSDFGFNEGVYDVSYKVPSCNHPSYWEAIGTIIEAQKVDVALVVPEPEVLTWAAIDSVPTSTCIPPKAFIEFAADKKKLFQTLKHTRFIPRSELVTQEEIRKLDLHELSFPLWIRPCHFGVTSARGACKVSSGEEAVNWINTLPEVPEWQIAEFCEGRNIAVSLLFHHGTVVRSGMYERLEYYAGTLFRSGVSGNISKGRLFHEEHLETQVCRAIEEIEKASNEKAHGFITVDLIAPQRPNAEIKITEVNVRPTAPVGIYGLAGFHILGDWLRLAIGREIGPYQAGTFPRENLLLRDIDGAPIFLSDPRQNKVIDLSQSDGASHILQHASHGTGKGRPLLGEEHAAG